ncbi:DMT family transporter [Nonomuraea sp. SYSU D8015]|uniref:DMT family transporter n=1 Tax=Nonomuraea sp. SYSU D8015 TaxID=2593644 RepID=UPI0016610449|nr:DMT family transporter [Nonomuraea sp. SYSU D8015]
MRFGGLLRLGALALLWGSGFLWIKIALRGFSPTQVTLIRLVLGALILVILVYTQGRHLPRGWKLWGHLVVAALFANAAPYLLFAIGEQTVDSSVAGIINCTTPLWTMILAYLTRHDTTISLPRTTGLLAGFAGTILIFAPWSTSNQIASWGGLACFAAAVCYAISYLYMDRHLTNRGLPPIVLSACQLTAASGLLLATTPFGGLAPISIRADTLVAITILGIFGTGFAYVLNYRIIQDDGAVVASVVTYLLPAIAVILGWAVLTEIPQPTALVGMLIVLLGVGLTRWRKPSPKSATVRAKRGNDL